MFNMYKALFVLMFACSALAQPPNLTDSKLHYGDWIKTVNARSLALGGTGIAGAYAVHAAGQNPAVLTGMENEMEGFLAGMVTRYEEDRSYPYYDNFGGFVDFGSYVYNSSWYGNLAGAINFNLTPLTGLQVVAGLSTNPVIGFNYDYVEEVRTTGFTDEILAYNKIYSEGELRIYSLSAAIEPVAGLSIGGQMGIITGSIDQTAEIFPVSDDLQEIAHRETRIITLEKNPVKTTLGIHFQFDPQFAAAAVFGFPFTINTKNIYRLETNNPDLPGILLPDNEPVGFTAAQTDYDSVGQIEKSRKIEYPAQLGLGLTYRFTNILEARLSADFEYIFWSDMKDTWRSGLALHDIYVIKLGVEHIFFDRIPFRVGFNYQPLKENKNYTRSIFTLGIGLLFDQYQVDFSGGFENLTSNQPDLFSNGLYPPLIERTEPVDRVKTSNFYGMVEVRFFFNDIIPPARKD